MTTLESMQAKIKKLEQQAEALIAKQSSGVIEKIRELMAKHGLTVADIDGHAGGKQPGAKASAQAVSKGSAAAVKYRDPKSGATWSGHGRAPMWIASAKNRDKFLADGGTVTTKPASAGKVKIARKKASKAVGPRARKGQPKGQQPALYRDPKSGATWSGRGRAPAWLADAKDRSKFLIDGNGTAADAKPVVTKAVAKKAPAAKKTAAKKAVSTKVRAKKALAKKAPRKSVAVPVPMATVESGAELTP